LVVLAAPVVLAEQAAQAEQLQVEPVALVVLAGLAEQLQVEPVAQAVQVARYSVEPAVQVELAVQVEPAAQVAQGGLEALAEPEEPEEQPVRQAPTARFLPAP
jgi:hypothetical protein